MSDTSLASFGFDVHTIGLRARPDDPTRSETRVNAAGDALARMEARTASAMSKRSAAIGGTAGASGGGASGPADAVALRMSGWREAPTIIEGEIIR